MERREDWDILRGIGIIAVVLGHCGIFSGLVYIFHIPLFVFVSGMLTGYSESRGCRKSSADELKKEIICNLRKKIARLYFPFVMIQSLFLIFHNVLVKYHWYSPPELSAYGFGCKVAQILTLGGGESLGGALWFLICLFEISILWELLRIFRFFVSEKCFLVSMIILSGILYVIGVNYHIPRSMSMSFRLFPYFIFGWGVTAYHITLRFYFSKIKWIGAAVCAILLFFGIKSGVSYCDSGKPWEAFFMAAAGIGCSAALAVLIQKSRLMTKVFCLCGVYSFSIMALHFTGFKIFSLIRYCLRAGTLSQLSGLCPDAALSWKIRFLYALFSIVFSITISYLFHKKAAKRFPGAMKYITGQWILAAKGNK